MKFVVTGGAGHVSKPLTELLLARGHEVTVIGRRAENLSGLVRLGAKAAVGHLEAPFGWSRLFSFVQYLGCSSISTPECSNVPAYHDYRSSYLKVRNAR